MVLRLRSPDKRTRLRAMRAAMLWPFSEVRELQRDREGFFGLRNCGTLRGGDGVNPYRLILKYTFIAAIALAGVLRFGWWNMLAIWGAASLLRALGNGIYKLLEVAETPSTRRFY